VEEHLRQAPGRPRPPHEAGHHALPRPGERPIPAVAGIGLRAPHHAGFIAERPVVGWVEVHSENFFGEGGPQLARLERVRRDYPLSCHGVGLSLGSTDPLDKAHLRSLKRLVDRFEPGFVSEHCSWSSVGGQFLNDLLPLPYTEEALAHMCARVGAVQDYLGRQLLIENPSTYLAFDGADIGEAQFLGALARETGCGLLLDVNNIYVSARNVGLDATGYLQEIPATAVAEIHLAGYTVNRADGFELLIDTHSAPVSAGVWELYERAIGRFGPVPTLVEWDLDLPELPTLLAEARRADLVMERAHELVA
jgi:uncharacterized protein (UPF0276 family)